MKRKCKARKLYTLLSRINSIHQS